MRYTARALVLVLLAAAGWAGDAGAQVTSSRNLLADLESTLRSGQLEEFFASHAPDLPAEDREWLTSVTPPSGATTVRVRERETFESAVLADVFLVDGEEGFVATWLIGLGQGAANEDARPIESIHELSRFGNLVRFALDESKPLRATGLVISGPDFTLRLPAGTVFVSAVNGRPHTLVVSGRSTITFTPPDPSEQGQLRIFAGAPSFTTTATDAFIRLNPDDYGHVVTWETLEPATVDRSTLSRARRTLETHASQGHRVPLGDLDADSWSLTPSPGSLLVAFNAAGRGWLTYNRAPQLVDDVSLFDRGNRRQISLYRSTAGPRPTFDIEAEPYDVTHTDVDVSFDPERLWLSGRATLTLRTRQATSAIQLRLAEPLVVSSAWSPEVGRLLPFRPSGQDALLIGLLVTVPAGDVVTVDVQYHGRLQPQELDGVRRRDPNLDLVAVESFGPRGGPRYLYSGESGWYPRASSGRHAPATLRLTVPDAFSTLATGQVETTTTSERIGAGRDDSVRRVRTTTFRTDQPVRYLAFLAAPMELIGRATAHVPSVSPVPGQTEPAREVVVNVFAGRDRTRDVSSTATRTAEIVEFYSTVMGEAPYPALAIAALEDDLPGGHSPAQFALINQRHTAATVDWSRDPVAFADFPDFFVAHEVAHQWWGQAVAGNDYRGQWISEGFAQYLAWMYFTSIEGEDAGRRLMTRMRESTEGLLTEGPISLGFRLGHLRNNPRVLRSILYNKSAVVLHMLRRLIGDEAFMRGLRSIYATHRFSLIDTDAIERAFQAQTAVPLSRFFARWVAESGVPVLHISWRQNSPGAIVVNVTQTGVVFDLPWEITVHLADGTKHRATLSLGTTVTETVIPVRGPVQRVDVRDPLALARVAE